MTACYVAAGQSYGRLIVREEAGLGSNGAKMWRCACVCGKEICARSSDLVRGNVVSCGCAKRAHAARAREIYRNQIKPPRFLVDGIPTTSKED